MTAGHTEPRRPNANIDPMFADRWSPRSFTPDAISDEEIAQLFEAARWAPSAMNEQPWRFVFARTEGDRATFVELLKDMNQPWAKRAPLLMFVFAKRHYIGSNTQNRSAPFDCGATWISLAFQARKMGLHTHAMAGIDREAVYGALGVPKEQYEVLAAIAVGRRGDPELLPPDLREREYPNERRPVTDFVSEATFQPGTTDQ